MLATRARLGRARCRGRRRSSARDDLPEPRRCRRARLRQRFRRSMPAAPTLLDDARRAPHAGAPRASRSSRSAPAGSCSAGASSARDGSSVEGLGILPGPCGAARRAASPATSSVASPRFGAPRRLREPCPRLRRAPRARPLGRIRAGHGNGRDSGQEGVVMGDVIGTHLHGPVLAKNPAFADRAARYHGRACRPRVRAGERAATWSTRYAAAAREAQLAAAGRASRPARDRARA